ncbi:fumarylacetoacetate hydrolase family protein [Microbacterium karelineae]|uniref:fumarylacetoacetate hydrolase family protein n=1 Tax=Microbacterium karelineae TaxID=2654283 RepID=UPI0012E9A76E|nr:fumarylacetoacetate hydrolase family protein [Microbacterium karelineae]
MTNTRSDDPRFAALPLPPGKIIAVHLSYVSRSDQRGRRPAHPSYFLKPTSSIAASRSDVARPAGCELLAFEGEIALVVDTAGSRISPERAWDHVGWVTAANDFGLYDLRANDKGSNLRNKGRDGYTPLGPGLIDARGVAPDALRVRTWRNGELVQDDTTADAHMLFPFRQLIADVSQHVTLEPGDIIVTGTPAGSSVAVPGDVVEVEVDAPSADGAPTTGRLISRVVEGPGDFDPDLGSLPAVDDHQREEAWGSREAAGLAPFGAPAMDPALRAKFERCPVAGLSQQLRKRGIRSCFIDGVQPLEKGAKLVGVAKTLRFVPLREDLFSAHGGGYNAQKRCFDSVKEGEVIVIEARGERRSGTLGDILALRAQTRGAAGIVTDGGVRDSDLVAGFDIPVFAAGGHPAVLGRVHVPWESDVTIACGGAAVQPGDIIVGDDDGVIVVPPGLAEEAVDAALAQEDEDDWIGAQVRRGAAVDGLFPMNAEWRARYEAESGGPA